MDSKQDLVKASWSTPLIVGAGPLPIVRTPRRVWSHFERFVRKWVVQCFLPSGFQKNRAPIQF